MKKRKRKDGIAMAGRYYNQNSNRRKKQSILPALLIILTVILCAALILLLVLTLSDRQDQQPTNPTGVSTTVPPITTVPPTTVPPTTEPPETVPEETEADVVSDDLPERFFDDFSYNIYTRENATHYAYLAAQKGLPMHLEKPCGTDDESFEKMLPEYIHYKPISMKRGVSFDGLKGISEMTKYFKKEKFDLQECFTLWLNTSKEGNKYLTGYDFNKNRIIGFYNILYTKKENYYVSKNYLYYLYNFLD